MRPANALEWRDVFSDRATTPCPDDDALAALLDRALAPDEAAQITAHIDDCAACQDVMLAAVRAGMAPRRSTAALTAPTAPVPSSMFTATRIGRYELRSVLGVGGMGVVYEAHDSGLDRAVAVKVLRPGRGDAATLADRLVRESRLMARAAHPSVITVYDVGREGNAVFIAMELVRGPTLTAWLASHTLDWRAIVSVFEHAGQGLAAAHGAGIVHRDFKPDNVLVASADKIVVTDFGIARAARSAWDPENAPTLPGMESLTGQHALLGSEPAGDGDMTETGMVIGTPAYMAPEQIRGEPVDQRADVFAFSVSLWEALFGHRPFPGHSVVEIFQGMHRVPVRPQTGASHVPRRLVRALQKGLAFEPADRWPDMAAMMHELSAIRTLRRRQWLAAGAAGLIGVGIATALAIARPEPPVDRCARALTELSAAYNPQLAEAVRGVLAGEPAIRDTVIGNFTATAEAWRAAHLATCRADRDVIQDATTTACLDARRVELAGSVDDVIANGPDGAKYAVAISGLPDLPGACAAPAPGLLFARVPADRALRRTVTALRDRMADVEADNLRNEFPRALAESARIASAAAGVWPPVNAEALYTLGMSQRQGGDSKLALATLRDAAVAAERAHHDRIAATAWLQIALAVANNEGDATRALEYTTYAEAAANRVGRPPLTMLRIEHAKGVALIAADRTAEGEVAVRKALELARTTKGATPGDFAGSLRSLGSLYENQGRYADAVAAQRDSIAYLPRSASGEVLAKAVFYDRLAGCLEAAGQPDAAELESRRAVELADRTLPTTAIDRAIVHADFAHILLSAGHDQEALAEITGAIALMAKLQGTRSERYGEALMVHGDMLLHMERYADADPLLARGCEILEFVAGNSATEASCAVIHSGVLAGLHRNAEALAKLDPAIETLAKTYGAQHPEVSRAVIVRGGVHAALGHHAAAVADLERAIAALATSQLDPGYLADARWQLGQELGASDPERARAEVTAASQIFETTGASWSKQRARATAWLARHSPRP